MRPLGRMPWLFILAAVILCIPLSGGCFEFNKNPVINSLEIENKAIGTSGNTTVKCIALDADSDNLSYSWSATGGIFTGHGSTVNWTAPAMPGAYTITVSVNDGKGGKAVSRLTVDITTNLPPVIESLTAEPLKVKQGKIATISCIAVDPDNDTLNYTWKAARGGISGSGSTINWTAPNTCGNSIIEVTVSDDRGGTASQNISIEVQAG